MIAKELAWTTDAFLAKSWMQRKADAIGSYAMARSIGYDKASATMVAVCTARVSQTTAKRWVRQWRSTNGMLSPLNWGNHKKVPFYFKDEEIRLKSAEWWRCRKPRKGKQVAPLHAQVGRSCLCTPCSFFICPGDKNTRIEDFLGFLVGTDANGHQGILTDLLSTVGKDRVGINAARIFTQSLGYEHGNLHKGTYSDKHEDEKNQLDRHERF